ncbi:ATP-binding cassette domain-containing protein [Thiococcus pfennigii]|jgi:zinc transport system ATP-binding protein|uniref:ATP-binding cassette domain-containing protein n=1 Tax=Thiococcus pfennigii TaxID=1057 RepID=UPI001908549B|nr:ATP-binding cassette domain-containing protein [Thiococcus pfennigii]MBK1702390.1 ABC transporter [Thiococcus pfennigii]MBK1730512.1 ABC transporter [Thiococcus pfennigii]
MTQTLIVANGLVAGYAKPVIGPLSFSVGVGEVVGLWGANGCGKSTLLRAIAGNARIFDGDLGRPPGLTLAWQMQQPVRLDEMPLDGHDYLRYAQAHRQAPPNRLAPWLDQRIDTLSGGQFQLLAVWAMLGGQCDLVMLDEPTNNLDPTGEQLLTEMLQSQQGRRAVLLASHERRFLDEACSRILEIGR